MGFRCEICDSSDRDEGIFGEMVTQTKHMLHRNCLILSMGKFVQDKHAGYRLLNYLNNDFLVEKRRLSLIGCSYCRRRGANLSCCHAGCTRRFHTKCGVDNLAVLQYAGKFDCFCAEHVPQPPHRPDPGDLCVICLCPVVPADGEFSPALAFQGPCCQNGWFHRDCVQDQSNATPENFRCPLCRNVPKYAEVAMLGVAVPKWRYAWPNPPEASNTHTSRALNLGRLPPFRLRNNINTI